MSSKPPKPTAKADPIAASVRGALGRAPKPGAPTRPPYKKLRAEIEAAREEYLQKLNTGTPMSQLHRSLCDQLARRNIKPISLNTLRFWLSPLP